MIDHFQIGTVDFDPLNQVIEQILGMGRAGGHGGDSECGGLPRIVKIDFGGSDVEFLVQSREKRFEQATLLFERGESWQLQFDDASSDNHVKGRCLPAQ